MNHSIYSADRMTHLKVVVVALAAGIAISGFAISARVRPDSDAAAVLKAGKPIAMTSSDLMLTR